jgi:hypothetical protein
VQNLQAAADAVPATAGTPPTPSLASSTIFQPNTLSRGIATTTASAHWPPRRRARRSFRSNPRRPTRATPPWTRRIIYAFTFNSNHRFSFRFVKIIKLSASDAKKGFCLSCLVVNANDCLMTRMQEMSVDYHVKVEQEAGYSVFFFEKWLFTLQLLWLQWYASNLSLLSR